MSEWLILFFALGIIYFFVQTATVGSEKSDSKPVDEEPVAVASPPLVTAEQRPLPNTSEQAQVRTTPEKPEMTMPERVGLTSGSVWHYLAENGATPVAKLLRELAEEEKIIQRSIGWLAQEGKVTLDSTDRTETIALKD